MFSSRIIMLLRLIKGVAVDIAVEVTLKIRD